MIVLRLIALFWKPIAWALGIGATYLKGRSDARAKRKVQDLEADQDANERINHADVGLGATDDQRIKRLRDFEAKYGNRTP